MKQVPVYAGSAGETLRRTRDQAPSAPTTTSASVVEPSANRTSGRRPWGGDDARRLLSPADRAFGKCADQQGAQFAAVHLGTRVDAAAQPVEEHRPVAVGDAFGVLAGPDEGPERLV